MDIVATVAEIRTLDADRRSLLSEAKNLKSELDQLTRDIVKYWTSLGFEIEDIWDANSVQFERLDKNNLIIRQPAHASCCSDDSGSLPIVWLEDPESFKQAIEYRAAYLEDDRLKTEALYEESRKKLYEQLKEEFDGS